MLLDAFLLDEMNKGNIKLPVLRTYGWEVPTLSLGASQIKKHNYKSDLCNINMVNRITGGQAVYHDTSESEITYSLVFNHSGSARKIYFEIGSILISFLNKYGLIADFGYSDKSYDSKFNCFDSKTSADIVVNNTKIIGSAQCRKKHSILQHGSIKLNKIRELVHCQQSFHTLRHSLRVLPPVGSPPSCGAVAPRMDTSLPASPPVNGTLNYLVDVTLGPCNIDFHSAENYLKQSFEEVLNITFLTI